MICKCLISDILWMVNLSHIKRFNYAKHQKQFWKMADNSDFIQEKYFAQEIIKDSVIALCCNDKQGFIIGKIINPPQVYDAGLTLMIDDFCVESENLWGSVGKNLIEEIKKIAKTKNVNQILVVCGEHDQHKKLFLKTQNLSIASNWYVGNIV